MMTPGVPSGTATEVSPMLDHLHPAVVHVPVGLAVVLPLIAAGLAFARWRGWLRPRSWTVLVALQAMVLAGALVAVETGEALEEHGERIAGERAVELHEEWAEVFAGAAGLALLVFGSVFLVRSPRPLAALLVASVASSVLVASLAVWTGHLGGRVTHGRDD
jgi:uncharacterized membrane protein